MPINDKYIVPASVVTHLQNGPRSFNALRLTHGILYWIVKWLGEDNLNLASFKLSTERVISCRDIADAVGPVGAKDNDWLHAAVSQLEDQGLFEKIWIERHRVHFVVSRALREAFPTGKSTKKNPLIFAKIRTDQIRRCRTLHDILFLTLVSLHGGKDLPKFLLPRLPVAPDPRFESKLSLKMANLPRREAEWQKTWEAASRAWISSAVRVGGIVGHAYLIAPKRGIFDNYVSEVTVKIAHNETKWAPEKLYKFPAGTRDVTQITLSGKKTKLSKTEVQAKLHQTMIV